MLKVTNISSQSISLDHITINPKESYTWLNSVVYFSLRRNIIRLRGMGLIQVEEYSNLSDQTITSESSQKVVEDIKEDVKPKRKTNSKKKSQNKGE